MKNVIALFLMVFVLQNCDVLNPDEEIKVVRENDKVYIVDKTKKQWDVTHAIDQYNFKAESFQYGLGPYAILPINNPDMWNPGDSGYPFNNQEVPIIGANLYNHIRAYPLSILSRHEIVNETFGSKPMAVGY